MNTLKPGDKLILKGKSLKGKNRIGQHGPMWIVIRSTSARVWVRSEKKTFNDGGGKMSHDIRFLDLPDDSDFEMEKI